MHHYSVHSFSTTNDLFLKKKAELEERIFTGEILHRFQSANTINSELPVGHIVVEDANKNTLGSISIYDNEHYKNTLVLGNYNCIDNSDVAKILFDAVKTRAQQEKYPRLIGPMNGTTWDNYRFCNTSSVSDYFSDPPQQNWFIQQWQENGFTEMERYFTAIDRTLHYDNHEALHWENTITEKNIRIRKINLGDYQNELRKLWALSSRVFANNIWYSPITENYFIQKYNRLNMILNPEVTLLAENQQGDLIGFIFCFDDHWCTTEKRIIIKTLARDPSRNYAGIAQVLTNRINKYALVNGYESILHAFMHINNKSSKLSAQLSGEPMKYYSLYQLQL
jgi:hypothetical protein